MKRIAALDSGSGFHIVSLRRKPFSEFFSKVIYLPQLKQEDLKDIDVTIVTCASSAWYLVEKKDIFYDFLKEGKTLVVMARNEINSWLKDVNECELPFNFWWWLNKKNKIDLKVNIQNYELFNYVKFEDMIWHYHGGLESKLKSKNVIVHKELEKSVFMDIEDYYGGRLIVTSLDPFYHHGSFFMPNATNFGFGILKFLTNLKD